MPNPHNLEAPRPFVKWAGGKGQLLGKLLQAIEQLGPFINYHEPFVGGGALFFALSRKDKLGSLAYLSDTNPHLIYCYKSIRDKTNEMLIIAQQMFKDHSRQQFEDLRKDYRHHLSEAFIAARFLYLNRACYNGLYRENRAGQFNVPWGKVEDIGVPDMKNIKACARALLPAWVGCEGYEACLPRIQPGDLVYFDPPYLKLEHKQSFVAYGSRIFGESEHVWLSRFARELAGRGVNVMLTQSDTTTSRKLYGRGWTVHAATTNRAISRSGEERTGVAAELIITSWPCKIERATRVEAPMAVRVGPGSA